MSDSDMDIDDDEVQIKPTSIAGNPDLLDAPIAASDSLKDEQSNIIKDSSISGKNIVKLEDEKGSTFSSFPAPGPGITAKSFPSGNQPEQKRAAILCKFFARGWCVHGNACKFLHVKENSNHTIQQAVNNMAGSTVIQSIEGRVSLLNKNGLISPHTRENIFLVNPPSVQRVFPFKNDMCFMSSSEIMGRESLMQNFCAENMSLNINNTNPFTLKSSFVPENRSSITSYGKKDMVSSGPPWTGSLLSSVSMNEYAASTSGHLENRKNMYGSGSLPTLQEISVSSDQDAEGNATKNKKKVSSNDWEPSKPFQASFTIPPYILPSSDALYDPFTDIEENLEHRSLDSPLSSKGKEERKNSHPQKDGDSASGPQARDCNNDEQNSSSCSQNQHQGLVARKNLEAHGVVEGVATSVVDQNDKTTSKDVSSVAAPENKTVSKRRKPAGHDSWRRSDGSSYKKTSKSDEIDGEVRSDAGTKVMRQFRTAVVETIKEMLKPLWREGRLSKDVHNTIVKKAAEKVVSSAVQLQQVPTDTITIEQYLSSSATRIVKLVEGYAERYGKPKVS